MCPVCMQYLLMFLPRCTCSCGYGFVDRVGFYADTTFYANDPQRDILSICGDSEFLIIIWVNVFNISEMLYHFSTAFFKSSKYPQKKTYMSTLPKWEWINKVNPFEVHVHTCRQDDLFSWQTYLVQNTTVLQSRSLISCIKP